MALAGAGRVIDLDIAFRVALLGTFGINFNVLVDDLINFVIEFRGSSNCHQAAIAGELHHRHPHGVAAGYPNLIDPSPDHDAIVGNGEDLVAWVTDECAN